MKLVREYVWEHPSMEILSKSVSEKVKDYVWDKAARPACRQYAAGGLSSVSDYIESEGRIFF